MTHIQITIYAKKKGGEAFKRCQHVLTGLPKQKQNKKIQKNKIG